MTFKEKLAKEHPELVNNKYSGGCADCPKTFGYTKDTNCFIGKDGQVDCTKCWNREIPEEKKEYGFIRARDSEYRYINGEPSGDTAKVQIEAVRLAANATQYLPVETIYAILGIGEYHIEKPEG